MVNSNFLGIDFTEILDINLKMKTFNFEQGIKVTLKVFKLVLVEVGIKIFFIRIREILIVTNFKIFILNKVILNTAVKILENVEV